MNIEDPKFRDALSDSASRFQLWERVLRAANAKTVVEVGVWKGKFAEHVLRQCEFIERYYMIDPWAKLPDWDKPFNVETQRFDNIYHQAMERTAFASEKVVVLRGRTKEVIDNIPDESLEFAYIDGDHTLRGITIDLIKLLPKIKKYGLIGGDDFAPNPWQQDGRFEPTLVCPFSIYFAEAMNLPIIALPFNQFLMQRRADSSFAFLDDTGHYRDISLNKLPRFFGKSCMKRHVKAVLKNIGFIK